MGADDIHRLAFGRCPACGKLRFISRKDARKAAKMMPRSGGHHLSTYWHEGYYHIGHLPLMVMRGRQDRIMITQASDKKEFGNEI